MMWLFFLAELSDETHLFLFKQFLHKTLKMHKQLKKYIVFKAAEAGLCRPEWGFIGALGHV